MDAIREETRKSLAESKEMVKFYRALAAVQTNAICRIMKGENYEDMKLRAEVEAENLINLTFISSVGQCGAGTIWDEVLQACVPIQ